FEVEYDDGAAGLREMDHLLRMESVEQIDDFAVDFYRHGIGAASELFAAQAVKHDFEAVGVESREFLEKLQTAHDAGIAKLNTIEFGEFALGIVGDGIGGIARDLIDHAVMLADDVVFFEIFAVEYQNIVDFET